jgi:isoquinoline 1-oxidoreductase subunit beta
LRSATESTITDPLATMQRRSFLVGCGGAAAITLAGLDSFGRAAPATDADTTAWHPFALLEITPANAVVIRVAESEMGQGVLTAVPMLIAEELELTLEQVRIELAPGASEFRDSRGQQVTGYSSSVSSAWVAYRNLAALARAQLTTAAAIRWRVPAKDVTLSGAFAVLGRRRASFAQLAPLARTITFETAPTPKLRRDWRLIGRDVARVDTPAKIDGSAKFGIDVSLPDMRIATIVRPPAASVKALRFDAAAVLKIAGVERVLEISSGIAIVANNTFAAFKARERIEIEWSECADTGCAASHRAKLTRALDTEGRVARSIGGPLEQAAAASAFSADYHVPFVAHAALEPLTAVAHVQPHRCDLWIGTQAPSRAQFWGAKLTGLQEDQVFVHNQFIGGAFGRRGEWDYYCEAIELAKLLGAPVKTMWTRADDLQHDFYRPAAAHRLSARLDASGDPTEFTARIAAPSIARRRSPEVLSRGHDFLLTQGLSDHPYEFARQHVEYHEVPLGASVGFWRSVGHSHNCFALECFIDELAHLAALNPLQYRLDLLTSHPRLRGVLERAAAMAGWDKPRSKGVGLGIAAAESYGTSVALVAEVQMQGASLTIKRVSCAVDCGIAVNPNIVRQQMESGIIFGLSAALDAEITLRNGAVEQTNYHDFMITRFAAAPPIDVQIIESDAAPSGCGEPATPVIAPAVANAVFAASGQRIRSLPLRPALNA